MLAPLHLAAAGWGAAAIGGSGSTSAALEALQAPFAGRMSDRAGRLLPMRVSLAAGGLCSLGLATGARPLLVRAALVVASLS